MKSLIKKTLPLLFVLSSFALAATLISKKEVNQKIAEIFQPYNNETTAMIVKFTDLNVDENRALDFGINAFIAKQGLHNKAILKLQNIIYHYGDGTNPTVNGEVTLNMDLVKALGQRNVDTWGEEIAEHIQEIASRATEKYGEAAKVQAVVDSLQKDSEGHFESAQLRLGIAVDLNKLPESVKAYDVEIKGFKLKLTTNRHLIRAKFQIVLNPLYIRFNKDQNGLKEFIEKLLNNDEKIYRDFARTAKELDQIVQDIVDKDSTNN